VLFRSLGGTEFNYDEAKDTWTPVVNTDVAKRALQLYIDAKPSAPPGSENADWDLSVRAFTSGDAAMMVMWDAFAGLVTDPKQSQVWNKVGYAVAPNGGAATLGGWGLCINKNSPHAKEAYQFLEWATGPETATKYTLDGPGAIPRKSIYSNPKVVAKQPWIVAQQGAIAVARGRSEAYRGGPTLIPEPQYEMILGTAVNAAFAGMGSPSDLLDKANEDLKDMLIEAGYKVGE
jgi:ABC-type glycerol-3-phosphate transport system substrate-binding protein